MAFDTGAVAASALSGSFGLVIFFVVLAAVGGIAGWYWYNKQFKYQVDLKVLKNGGFTKYYDTARLIRKNGEHYWKLRSLKEIVSVPPPESISQTVKGGWVADGYYERNIGVLWSCDKMTVQQFEALSKSLHEKRKNDPSVKFDAVETQYQPITSQERAMQAAAITKAQLRKGKSGWELLRDLIGPVFMFLVLILIVIFWNKIAAPVIELQQTNAQLLHDADQLQQQNLRFYMMLTGGKGNSTYIVQQLPEDQQTFPGAFQQQRTGGPSQ